MLAGGTEEAKRWKPDMFAILAERVRKCYDISSVILGVGAVEQAIGEAIEEKAAESEKAGNREIINLVGRTSLAELTAILKGAQLVVGNDSGPLHIAAALGVPVIGLYGPTNPVVVGPYGQMDNVVQAGKELHRRRRHRYSREEEHQIDKISIEQVLETVQKIVKG